MSTNFAFTISAIDKSTETIRKINANVDKLLAPFDRLSKSLKELGKEVAMNRLAQGLTKVGTAAENVARKMSSIVTPLRAILGIGTLAGVAELASGYGKLSMALINSSSSIGDSTQELQKWQGVAKLAGLGADDMTGALSNVGEKLDNAFRDPETVRNMEVIGLRMRRLKNGSVDTAAALLDIAGAMEKYGNVESKKRVADAFGLSALFPLLVQGRAAVEKLYAQSSQSTKVFTPEQIEAGRQYAQQVYAVEQSMTGLKNTLGLALLPAMDRIIGAVERLVGKYGDVISSKVAEYSERIAKWLDATDWTRVTEQVSGFVNSIGGVKTIAIALAAITFAGPIASVVSLIANLSKLAMVAAPAVVMALGPITLGVAALAAAVTGLAWVAKQTDAAPVDEKNHPGQRLHNHGRGGGSRWETDLSLPQEHAGMHWQQGGRGGGSRWVEDAPGSAAKAQANIAMLRKVAPTPTAAPAPTATAAPSVTAGVANVDPATLFASLEKKNNLPSGLLDSVWDVESSRGVNMNSPKGAMGHFGFMPDTAQQYKVTNPYDLTQSATGAAKMYKDLLKTNGGDLNMALAGYNWGQGNLENHGLAHAPNETKNYIEKVRSRMGQPDVATRPPQIAAALPVQTSAQGGANGTVAVTVEFRGAPKGTTANVVAQGNVTARIATSGLTEAPL